MFQMLIVRLGAEADISECLGDVRFTPKSGHGSARFRCPLCAKSRHSAVGRNSSLFNHLVGTGKQGRRNGQFERLSGRQIDQQL